MVSSLSTRWLMLAGWVLAACTTAEAQPRPRRDAGAEARAVARPRTGRRARADAGSAVLPPTHGRIEPAEAQRVLRHHADALRRCYQDRLARDPDLRGEVVVRVRVEPDGAVSETSTGGDPALASVGRCMGLVLRRARFPRPTGGAATVTAPFVLAPGE